MKENDSQDAHHVTAMVDAALAAPRLDEREPSPSHDHRRRGRWHEGALAHTSTADKRYAATVRVGGWILGAGPLTGASLAEDEALAFRLAASVDSDALGRRR